MVSFSNRAYLFWNNKTAKSNIVKGMIAPRIVINKTAVEQSYSRCGKITYIINVINPTPETARVTLTDDLGAAGGASPLSFIDGTAAVFIDGVRAAVAPTETSPSLAFPNLSVPAGAVATIVYQARVSACADGEIKNTATLSRAGSDPIFATCVIGPSSSAQSRNYPHKYTYSILDIKCDNQ